MFLWVEAFRFALHALRVNVVRTLLSLLGMTVGIFAIVMVFTAIDSLKREIKSSMAFLGDEVIYVQKWPWNFKPGFAWWRYLNRPTVKEHDFYYLERNVTQAAALALVAWREDREFKAGSRTINASLKGGTYTANRTTNIPIAQGRYFSLAEAGSGAPVAIVGAEVAATLFPGLGAIGRTVYYRGLPLQVIGVMRREGKTLIGTPSNDNSVYVPFAFFKRVQKIGNGGVDPMVVMKARADDPGMVRLQEEVRLLMRARHNLRPSQEDNFSINKPEMITSAIDAIFAVFTVAGAIIGSFSILVGGFGIANIMFVSVRERQSQIGIQKALGARRGFILWQFLFEAMLLSLAGGVLGIGIVYLCTTIPQDYLRLELTLGNIRTGLLVSAAVGLAAGTLPALKASRMDPVEAIRS